MPRRMLDPTSVAEVEYPRKRIAVNGNRLPDQIREGEIFTDVTGNRWRLGKSIGVGGFGEIYLASSDISRTVGHDAQHVIKIEPHKNGPLFVEMNFYIRAAKPEMITEWQRRKRLKHLGLSRYHGSGSHVYKGERYRFLVLQRFGQDLNKLFLKYGCKFHTKTVLYLGIQILDALEYIHNHGYIHADIKGSNLLVGHCTGVMDRVHLLDYGLACRYVERNGVHKEYRCDQRKAHNGTLEYTSRDAHIGAHSRRGDLEILGYNMLQWLCSMLPWEDSMPDPEYIHEQKKSFMANIPLLMRRCFPNSEPPAVLSQYLKYVAGLGFDTEPDYIYCRKLFRQGIADAGFVDDGKLEFGANLVPRIKDIKVKKRTYKRRSTEEPENISELKPKKIIRSAPRQPCVAHNFNRMTRNSPASPVLRSHQHFSWEKVISSNPERNLKKQLTQRVAVKLEPRARQPEQLPSMKSSEPDDPGTPTPAMLEVMARIRERERVTIHGPGVPRKTRTDSSRCSSPTQDSLFPYALTPAMEQVVRRREEVRRQKAQTFIALDHNWEEQDELECVRVTRSGVHRLCRRSPRNRSRSAAPLGSAFSITSANNLASSIRQSGLKKKSLVKKGYHGLSPTISPRILRNKSLRG